jgi:hypothetical protein
MHASSVAPLITQPPLPLEAVKGNGTLHHLVPDIDTRPELLDFLTEFLLRVDDSEQRNKRRIAQQKLLQEVERNTSDKTDSLQALIFDMDHTMAPLYPISSVTGAWALDRIAQAHGLNRDNLFAKARGIDPEFLCHSPVEFKRHFAAALGECEELNPDHPKNVKIMEDWRLATRVLNNQLFFKDIGQGIRDFKRMGGLVYIATNAPPANAFHRLHLWFGAAAAEIFDGVAVRETLPGMSANNPYANQAERQLVQSFRDAGKEMIVPVAEIKPHGSHLNHCLNHARKLYGDSINPRHWAIIGDSLGSDGGASRNVARFTNGVPMQFIWTVKAIVADHGWIATHRAVANPIDVLGVEPVLDKIHEGNYVRPHLAITELGEIFAPYHVQRLQKKLSPLAPT